VREKREKKKIEKKKKKKCDRYNGGNVSSIVYPDTPVVPFGLR